MCAVTGRKGGEEWETQRRTLLEGMVLFFLMCQQLESEVLGKKMKLRRGTESEPGPWRCQGTGRMPTGSHPRRAHAPGLCSRSCYMTLGSGEEVLL